MSYLGRKGAPAGLTSADIPDDSITASKIASGAITAADVAADMATQTELDALAYQGEPHIIPGVLYPAVAGKLLDGSTSHSGNYGTAQADGYSYYYTDIKGSKPIKDPRIGGHFGSQRHKIRSPQLLEQETATHGYNCYSVDGREWMRISGTATTDIEEKYYGSGHMIALKNATDFIEATGYFSDVNIIMETHGNYDSWTKQLNGATASAGQSTVTADSPLTNRYVDSGSVLNLGLSATLGINTVRINAGADIYLSGIELIAQDTSSDANKVKIQIPSQNVVSYGKKFTVSGTPHYDPFNGFTSGTDISGYIDEATSLGMSNWKVSSTWYRPFNGGRVVKWVDSSGNIKTSVTMMPPNAQNISSTASNAIDLSSSQTNDDTINFNTSAIENSLSEVAKTFHIREFGNGAANQGNNTSGTLQDFSMANAVDDWAYVMDDGLTSASSTHYRYNSFTEGLHRNSSSGKFYHTFIGTGIGRTSGTAHTGAGSHTLAQNLSYGTHILSHIMDGADSSDWFLDGIQIKANSSGGLWNNVGESLTIHQPKKPPIPEDAVVLADYMLMADFVPRTANGLQYISKGTRYCAASRDVFYDAPNAYNFYTNVADVPTAMYVQNNTNHADNESSIPSFSTNAVKISFDTSGASGVARRQTWKTNGSTIADGDLSFHASESSTHATYYYPTANVTLGNNVYQQIGTTGDSNPVATEGYELAIPIHTSSHYQTFETPYLHELVGGDRNMEQTNLVVTPDGKTWDELRDTSYIGKGVLALSSDAGQVDFNVAAILDDCRGWKTDPSKAINFYNKDFAIGYDRLICLKDGAYQINMASLFVSANSQQGMYLKVNGNVLMQIHTEDDNWLSGSYTCEAHLKRGDYVQVFGGYWTQDEGFSALTIFRI